MLPNRAFVTNRGKTLHYIMNSEYLLLKILHLYTSSYLVILPRSLFLRTKLSYWQGFSGEYLGLIDIVGAEC